MIRFKVILISVSFLIINSISAQQLFFLDKSSDIVATKDKDKTINLVLNVDFKNDIFDNRSSFVKTKIPFFNNKILDLKLEIYTPNSNTLVVTSTSSEGKKELDIHPNILSYKVFYKDQSIGILNLFNNQINGVFIIDEKQYEISRFQDSYVLFESSNSINNSNFSCEVEEIARMQYNQINSSSSSSTPICLELALEIDNYTRNTFNSNLETTNWALAIIAGVSLIYESEINVAIQVIHINIWTTVDPYNSYVNQSSGMLAELRNYWSANNGFVARDLVHMLTKRSNTGTGGIAYRDVLCNNNWGYGFSAALNNDTTYTFPNPSYTWNLMCVSHEIGHNVSSRHTHWCGWSPDPLLAFPGGVIDNCVDVEGSCLNNPSPVLGTIMSYCHTTSGGSILDFHNVVTTQALIPGRDNAFCLTTCDYYGCTDSSAFNYDPTATIDDGSCIPIVYGCIDTIALNFDSTANTDDGSCTYCSMLTFNKSDVSCYGNNDGSIDLIVSGGTSPFTYSWTSSTGFVSNAQDLSNLSSALYTVIVTDINGCSETSTITINEPLPINISGSNVTDVSCNGLIDGSVSLIVTGGTLPYIEDWGIYNPNALSSGSYTAYVTDVNNCPMDSINVIVNQPLPITVVENVNNITCNAYNNGSIDIIISGGTFPYTYNWSSTNGYFSINEDINNLQSGTYTVIITDSNLCTNTFSYNISEPSQLLLNSNVTNVSCYGAMDGSIDLTVSGGVPPYTFVWSNGSTSEDLTNIPSSNYWVNLIDDNQCAISTQYFTVSQPNASIVNSVTTDVSCNGFSDGNIDITFTPSSNGSNVIYLWAGPNNFSSVNEDINNIATGLYTLTISELPCFTTEIFYINEPDVLTISENIQHVNCFGDSDGQANLTISGGTPPFVHNWFGANSNALSAGIYYYEITDSNHCLITDSVAINQPSSPISVITNVANVSCYGGNNGIAQLNISGGISPYTTIWQNANPNQLSSGYSAFVISDDNQCVYTDSVLVLDPPIISVVETIEHVSCHGEDDGEVNLIVSGGTAPYNIDWGIYNNTSLSAGSYIYQIYDANLCSYSSVVNVTEPLPISVIPTIINASCPNTNDGSVQTSISGGTPPYLENWQSINPAQIAPGLYTYFISDSNQCIDTHQVIIGSVSNIAVQEIKKDISCFGFCDGNVSLYISGGIAPYITDWFSYRPDSLCEGSYSYQITDSLQCVFTDTISIIEPQSINLSISQQMNQLSANVTGGTPPYSYYWWNSSTQLGVFSSAFVFSPGTYYCIVFDSNQCHSDTVDYFVTEVDLMNDLSSDFNVFPNPFSDNINILFSDQKQRNIVLFDALGRVVYRNSFYEASISVDTKKLSSSIYVLKIETSKQVFYRRIIKK